MRVPRAKKVSPSSPNQPFAISYLRFSTPEQRKGDTVRRQLKLADEWSVKNKVAINETIRDAGVSAFRGKNALEGNLARFLGLIKSGKIPAGTYFLVESLDRLSREAAHKAFQLMFEIIGAGIRIVSLTDGMEYSEEVLEKNPGALFLWLGTAIRSNWESVEKSKRVREAWDFKREQAATAKKVLTARVPGWLVTVGSGRNRRIEIREERAEVVRMIFRMTIDGYGRHRIVKHLNNPKSPTPTFRTSEKWGPTNVVKILTSRAVFGEFQPHVTNAQGQKVPQGEPIKDYFPAILSEAEFNQAAAAVLSRRGAAGRRGPTMVNLLQGMVYCVSCNHRMSLVNKGAPPKGQRYFVCSANARGVGCSNSAKWRADLVENAVLDRALKIDWSELDLTGSASVAIVISQKHAELRDVESKASALLSLVEEDDKDEEARNRYRKRRAQAKALASEIATLEAEQAREISLPPPGQREEIIMALRDRLEASDPEGALALRTKISQTLKWSIEKIVFGVAEVSVRYRSELERRLRNAPLHRNIIARTPALIEAMNRDAELAEEIDAIERAELVPIQKPFWRYIGRVSKGDSE